MTFRRLLIATILSSLLITCIYGAPKKVIILTGDDLTHASGTHEFYAGGLLLKSSLENSNVKDKVACEVIHNWDGDVTALEGLVTKQRLRLPVGQEGCIRTNFHITLFGL